ncbi:MAG: acetyltransferase [Oscillospiraceae bacterium]|nr:acetyltransferase [Oscillospiraceae bacterium]
MKNLVIIGTGGFGRETANMVEQINRASPEWNLLGLAGEGAQPGQTVEGFPILGDLDAVRSLPEKPYLVIAFADPKNRKRLADALEREGYPFATLIHPDVVCGRRVTIGAGSIVCAKSTFTTNVQIGKHCILNIGTTVGHDAVLDDCVSVMDFCVIAGETHIAAQCYFGLNCMVINLVDIQAPCIFGAGAVVVRNLTQPGTYAGVPARKIK